VDAKAYWIAFNQVSGIGPSRLSALLAICETIEAAWKAPIHQLKAAGLDRRSLENLLSARRRVDLAVEWERVQRSGVTVLTWDDADYPASLRRAPHAPPVLFVRGTLQNEDRWAVAVVGTRRASAYGREVAHTLATELARNGITVVSGLALGIDAVAHQAALDAGGRTLAVLGSGVDQLYPQQNRTLGEAITHQGGVISEYALGTRPEARNFPPRNRIISGLSRGVVVVEAGTRSGALITAKFALEQGREVFAVPGSIFHPGSAGCNQLISNGATPLLSVDEMIGDILGELNMTRVQAQASVAKRVPADPMEQALLDQLSNQPSHVDDIVRQSAISAQQVSGLLTIMELKGLVRQVGTMRYVRA
jgi:DNA processing protein